MAIVNPQWLQNTRSQLDDETIVNNLIKERPQLQKVLEKANFVNPSKSDYTKLLNVWSGTDAMQQPAAQAQQGSAPIQDANQALGAKGKSFFSRAFESIQSVPERFQRSFGSEQVRDNRSETSKGFDIADLPGDIADVAGRALPVVGSVLGGSVGGIMGAVGGGVGAAPGAVIGSGVGAGVGESGRQFLSDAMGVNEKYGDTENPSEFSVKSIGKEGVLGAAGEIGGQLVAKAGGKLLAPFASRFSDDVARIAQRESIDLPASALSDSKMVGLGDALASKGMFGGKLAQTVDTATVKITAMADDIVKSFGGSDDILTAGNVMTKSLDDFETMWRASKDAAYKQADELLNTQRLVSTVGELKPEVNNTISLLDSFIGNEKSASKVLGDKFSTKLFTDLRNNLVDGQDFNSILNAVKQLSTLSKHGDKSIVATGDTAVFRKISATLDEDIMSWLKEVAPDAYKALDKADQVYKTGIETLNSAMGRTIEGLAREPEKILNKVFTKQSPSKAKEVLNIVLSTPDGALKAADLQSAFVRKILNEAQGTSDDIIGKSFTNTLNKYGEDLLNTVLGKDATKLLYETAKLSNALQKSQNIAGGSQTAFLSKLSTTLSAATGMFYTGIWQPLAAIVAGDAALTTIFNSALGKKWVTEGLTAPNFIREAGKAIVKTGIQEGADGMID